MTSINDFKAHLTGGGARANQFRVTIFSPPGIAIDLNLEKTSFLCRASTLPANQLTEIEIPFRGRKIYIAGDREFGDPWTTTFMNDTDFGIRNAMEKWSNGINDLEAATGVTTPSEYMADLVVEHLDRDDAILKSYIFRSAWPTEVTAIDLTSDAADAIEEFDVTWRYQHFEASGVNF